MYIFFLFVYQQSGYIFFYPMS